MAHKEILKMRACEKKENVCTVIEWNIKVLNSFACLPLGILEGVPKIHIKRVQRGLMLVCSSCVRCLSNGIVAILPLVTGLTLIKIPK